MRLKGLLCLPVLLLCSPLAGYSQTQPRIYRLEVEFFMELSEAEVAEAALGPVLRGPAAKLALAELRQVERHMLTASWSAEQWANYWGKFIGNATAATFKEFEKSANLQEHSSQARLWMAMEQVRLLLLAYRPLEAEPARLEHVREGFRQGADLVKVLQDNIQQNPKWSMTDTESIRIIVIGYKVTAFANRKPKQTEAASAKPVPTQVDTSPSSVPASSSSITLHEAVAGGDLKAIRLHLDNGADPNEGSRKANPSPLHVAAERNQVEAARLLLNSGADPNVVASYPGVMALRSPLRIAGEHESLEVAYLLLENGAKLSWSHKTGDSFQKRLYRSALRKGHRELAQFLELRSNIDTAGIPTEEALGQPRLGEEGLIRKSRQWWVNYLQNLKNYICERTINWYDFALPYESKAEKLDDLIKEGQSPGLLLPSLANPSATSTIQIIGGKEKYEFKGGDHFSHKYHYGDFMAILGIVLDKRRTRLRWTGSERVRGMSVEVLATETKNLITYYMPRKDRSRKAKKGPTLGFRGKLYVEKETGRVVRFLALDPIGLKPKHRIDDVAFISEYGQVLIDGEAVWLPIGQYTVLNQEGMETGNIAKFQNYRKFRTETKLSFEE